ncbi:XRE family transcriptional regulator [Kribbella sp. NPDC055071]
MALTRALGVDEERLWPELAISGGMRRRPAELAGVYARRGAIAREEWASVFDGAQTEIGILTYSALFLLEDPRIQDLLAAKTSQGVRIRIALGTPDSTKVVQRGTEELRDEVLADRIRAALGLLGHLPDGKDLEVRLHDAVLYNSIYRSDEQLLVNQHAYGIPVVDSPVFHFNRAERHEMFDEYVASFETIWSAAEPINR